MQVEELTTDRLGAVERFLRDLSELDRTFIKEDLTAATVASWASPDQRGHRGRGRRGRNGSRARCRSCIKPCAGVS